MKGSERVNLDRAASIRLMFGKISHRYDLMNMVITLGLEKKWKRYVADIATSSRKGLLLDVGSGTGGISMEAIRMSRFFSVISLDFSLPMMKMGRLRQREAGVNLCSGDALMLPFADKTFDAVTSGYLIRNVSNPLAAFREQYRVLKPGGKAVCLETSPPGFTRLSPIIRWYLRSVIPLLGRAVGRDRDAYGYLAATTESFMRPDALASLMAEAGFEKIWYKGMMLDTQMIHVGIRPDCNKLDV